MAEVPLPTRLFESMLGAYELSTVYLGVRLGCYAALAADGPANAAELAERCGFHARYAREWLEQQAVSGFLDVDDPAADAAVRRYVLPEAHAALADPAGTVAAMAFMHAGIGSVTTRLVDVFRRGTGLAYADYGADTRDGQSGFVRDTYPTLLPAVLRASIAATGHADWSPERIVDLGCGVGWSSLALADAYPDLRVDGLDSDVACIGEARANAVAAGVQDRVSFEVCDAADPAAATGHQYDAAFFCDVLHDLARPVEALASARELLTERGFVVVVDEAAGEAFVAPGDQLQRGLYVASVLHCLPVGMAEQPSAATGALMRVDTLRGYAREAGFAHVRELPVEAGAGMRAYLLTA
jgi:2-polyprenyl-3-methyl-5-hydroxy-6-metoxy-1,4-benzoquinol methylase